MEDDKIVDAIRERASERATRTDYADRDCPELAPPVPLEVVSAHEIALGFPLYPFHQRLLTEVGNGGFGPGDGLIGLPGGRLDDDGHSLIDLRAILWTNSDTAGLPERVVALCNWGDAIWSCIDSQSGHVLTLNESGLTDTGQSLQSWFNDWIIGVSLFGKMFTFMETKIINPFTKQLMTVRAPARALGTPYRTTE